MTTKRVTVSLSEDVQQTAQRIADELGMSFSAVVADALTGWLRGRLVDTWLREHQAEHGAFDEDEAASGQRNILALNSGFASTRHDEQPLIGAPMAVARTAFATTGRNRHLRRLRQVAVDDDAKAFSESEMLHFHGRSLRL